MKAIIINTKNADRINQAIAEAEGHATARIIDASMLMDSISYLERHLRISKSAMLGITADIDYHAQTFPHAYKYTPESTHVTVERTTSGWKLTRVYRGATRTAGHTYLLDLPMASQLAIVKSMEDF